VSAFAVRVRLLAGRATDCHVRIGRLEEMEATVKVMDNASKINDWVAINNGEPSHIPLISPARSLLLNPTVSRNATSPLRSEFDKLTRFVTRHQTLTSTLPPAAQTPALYIKSIIDMDVQIADVSKKEKDSKKKMNAANAKGLNGMKQKIKKQLREFETAVEKYKQVGLPRS